MEGLWHAGRLEPNGPGVFGEGKPRVLGRHAMPVKSDDKAAVSRVDYVAPLASSLSEGRILSSISPSQHLDDKVVMGLENFRIY